MPLSTFASGSSRSAVISLVVLFACCVARAAATEPEPKLSPGGTIVVRFPDMPPTFYSLFQKNDTKAQMTVFLPFNYDAGRKFPVLVFLNGWDGGVGGNPGVARSICQGRDFVCVSVPLFKAADYRPGDKPNVPGPNFIMRPEDGKAMLPLFERMMDKLKETVPNLDADHWILGGFSNGAHATAGMIEASEGKLGQQFSAFFLVEGGGKLRHFELIKGKPLLVVSSNAKSRHRAEQICDDAKAAGVKATLLVEDVGKHDFPTSAYSKVAEWLRGPAMQGGGGQ